MSDTQRTVFNLDQPREGYRDFLSAWIVQAPGLAFVVDPGPRSTVGALVRHLADTGIVRVDYVLLTHIHLDHAGGTAELLDAFPGARAYCHESGVEHLTAPARLWKGSQSVLGEVAAMYGEPRPVPRERLATAEELAARGVTVIPTPGHAIHHVSFLHEDVLFAGEALGTRVPLPSGRPYLRPATPPRFFLEEALASLDRLLGLAPEPKMIVFAHFGSDGRAFEWCRRAKVQLASWVGLIRTLLAVSPENLEQRLFDELMQIDPLYGQGRFDELAPDLKVRERHFLGNTLDGIRGYIEARERAEGGAISR